MLTAKCNLLAIELIFRIPDTLWLLTKSRMNGKILLAHGAWQIYSINIVKDRWGGRQEPRAQ